MPDLKLKKLTVRNWMRLNESEIEFPERGLILLTGKNTASQGSFLSIGSGKTSIGEAICRTLLGVEGRFTHYRSCSTRKKGDTYVRVEAEHQGQPLIVESGFKCPELGGPGEALRYQYGTQAATERATLAETRLELSALLGVSPELAKWTVFIDGKKLEFSRISQEDAVTLLMAALAQPPWPAYYERAKKVTNNFDQTVSNLEATQAQAQKQAQTARTAGVAAQLQLQHQSEVYTKAITQNNERIQALRQTNHLRLAQIEEIQSRQKSLSQRLAEIEAQGAETQHQLEIERHDLADRVAAATTVRSDHVDRLATARQQWRTHQERLQEMQGTPKACPTCLKPWDAAHSQKELAVQESLVQAALAVYKGEQGSLSSVDVKLGELRQQQRQTEARLNQHGLADQIVGLSQQWETLDEEVTGLDQARQQAELEIERLKHGVPVAALEAARAVAAERQQQLDLAEASLLTGAAELVEAKEAARIVQYWYKAFHPAGIQNMILAEAITPLNRIAATISRRMTGGTVQVTFATEKELASGRIKSKLIVKVDNDLGASEIQGNSKGEGGLSNFIIAETLSEVGRVSDRIGFRWYDEIVPNQDPVVAKTIYTYLRDTAHRLGLQLFLVEHDPVAANYADYILEVEKVDPDQSVVRWR